MIFFLQGNPLYFFLTSLKKKIRELPLNLTRVHFIVNSHGIFFYKEIPCKNLVTKVALILLKICSDEFPKFSYFLILLKKCGKKSDSSLKIGKKIYKGFPCKKIPREFFCKMDPDQNLLIIHFRINKIRSFWNIRNFF